MLKLDGIQFSIGEKKIVNDVSAEFLPGKISMILGPNGSGKSTLLKIFSGTVAASGGNVYYDEQKITTRHLLQLSKYRAVLGQQPELSFPMTVEEVVMMGRYPHFNTNPGKKDVAICEEVMEKMNLPEFRERNYLTLSGGEKQRVQFARVLSQIWEQPQAGSFRYLFLDEPLNNLDINYQHEFLLLAKKFCNSQTVIVAIMHDINLAIQFADEVYVMNKGMMVARGTPAQTISEALIKEVFHVNISLINNPENGEKIMVFKNQ